MSDSERQLLEADRYHHGNLRQSLIDAGRAALVLGGPSGIGLRELARSVGVSPAAPYRHFKSREALLAALAEEGFEQFRQALVKSTQGIPSKYHLAVMGMAYVDFARANKALFHLMFSPDLDKSEHPGLLSASDATFALLATTAGMEAPDKAREAVLGSWALVHGLAHLVNDGHFPPMGDAEGRAMIAAILKRSIEGMRALRQVQAVAP